MRRPAVAVAIVINRLMRVVPPPSDLLVGEHLLIGGIGIARLQLSIARRKRHDQAGPVRIKADAAMSPASSGIVIPIEILATLNPRLNVRQAIDCRRP